MNLSFEDRTLELLVDWATEGLDPIASGELDTLLEQGKLRQGKLGQGPGFDTDSFELAAAAIELAYTVPEEPLPSHLRDRITFQATQYFDEAAPQAPATVQRLDRWQAAPAPIVQSQPAIDPNPSTFDATRWLGWLAAAAMLVLTIANRFPESPEVVDLDPVAELGSATGLDPATARGALIAQGDDLIQLPWTATEDPAATGASGDIVWNSTEQTGFMLFRGLQVNDPASFQYQLWIFDATRDERYPIDGGVFDIMPGAGEIVVPIDPKLLVIEPTLFAVTIEPPGGVVVSSRERLPLLAKIG